MELFDHLITWWLSRPAAAVIGILVALEAGLAGTCTSSSVADGHAILSSNGAESMR